LVVKKSVFVTKKNSVTTIPIALVKMEGTGGGDGDGAALQGSRPSYVVVDAASGFSSTKLAPKLTEEEVPYACVGRGALNIMKIMEDEQACANLFNRPTAAQRNRIPVWRN
jgi:hypothetical protein